MIQTHCARSSVFRRGVCRGGLRLSLIVTALLIPGAVFGQTISPSDDAHVSTAFPAVNFGSAPLLQVGATAGAGSTRAYIKFSLATLPAGLTAASVSKVSLVLFVNTVGTGGLVRVSSVAGAWSEGTITSASQPDTGNSLGSIYVSAASQFVSLDVTSAFVQWLAAPQSNYGVVLDGLALENAPQSAVYFDSKESVTTSHQPVLQVVLAGSGTYTVGSGTSAPLAAGSSIPGTGTVFFLTASQSVYTLPPATNPGQILILVPASGGFSVGFQVQPGSGDSAFDYNAGNNAQSVIGPYETMSLVSDGNHNWYLFGVN